MRAGCSQVQKQTAFGCSYRQPAASLPQEGRVPPMNLLLRVFVPERPILMGLSGTKKAHSGTKKAHYNAERCGRDKLLI